MTAGERRTTVISPRVSGAGVGGQASVRVHGELVCANQHEVGVVRAHLAEHIALTRAEPGCVTFTVAQTDDPLVWRVDEQFVDAAALEVHQARTRGSTWALATAGIIRRYTVGEAS